MTLFPSTSSLVPPPVLTARTLGLTDTLRRSAHPVEPEPLRAIDDWLAPYRARWTSRLDDLERHLDDMDDPNH